MVRSHACGGRSGHMYPSGKGAKIGLEPADKRGLNHDPYFPLWITIRWPL